MLKLRPRYAADGGLYVPETVPQVTTATPDLLFSDPLTSAFCIFFLGLN